MTTRNRTTQFLNIRQSMRKRMPTTEYDYSRSSPSDGQKSLLSSSGTDNASHVAIDLPPIWVDTVDKVNEDLRKIKARLQDLSTAHSQHLLPGFDDVDGKEQEVEVLTTELSRLFKTCEAKIRHLKDKTPPDSNQNENRVLLNLQTQLATQLSSLYTQFRKSQKAYLSKLQGQQQKSSDFVNFDDDGGDIDFGFDPRQRLAVQQNETMLKEREAEITKITESIEDLAILFKDLHTLVIDQGTILDRIDYNIEQVQQHVEEAVVQLKKAETSQKKSKLMLCIYILLMMCGALVLVLVIKHSGK